MSGGYVALWGSLVGVTTFLCAMARARPGGWVEWVNRALAGALLVVTAMWLYTTEVAQHFSLATSLPLALCDLITLVAVLALVTKRPLAIELLWFTGMAGTLQALITPDLSGSAGPLEVVEYLVAHGGIVVSAMFLVVGQRYRPRPRAAGRVFGLVVAYTGAVGVVDWLTGGDYMFLAHKPAEVTLLQALGPWPWYIGSAALVAIGLLWLLSLPFSPRLRRLSRRFESHPLPMPPGQSA
jgi:hypothetical integral membrane protein (TIGR02206 family)